MISNIIKLILFLEKKSDEMDRIVEDKIAGYAKNATTRQLLENPVIKKFLPTAIYVVILPFGQPMLGLRYSIKGIRLIKKQFSRKINQKEED